MRMEAIEISKDCYTEEYNKLQWVLKVRSKDKEDTNLRHLLVRDGFVICTDGVRLHMAQNIFPRLADGVYYVERVTSSYIKLYTWKETSFPDVWKLFEGKRFNSLVKKLDCNGDKTPFMYAVCRGTDTYYDVDCLMDMYIENSLVDVEESRDDETGVNMLVASDGERLAALMSKVFVRRLEVNDMYGRRKYLSC